MHLQTMTLHSLHMLPLWGVEPFMLDFPDTPDATIQDVWEILLEKNWAQPEMDGNCFKYNSRRQNH